MPDFDAGAALDEIVAAPMAVPAAAQVTPATERPADPARAFDAGLELDRILEGPNVRRRPPRPPHLLPMPRASGYFLRLGRTLGEASVRGVVQAGTEFGQIGDVATGPQRGLNDLITGSEGASPAPPPPAPPGDHIGELLEQRIGVGWRNPEWWVAQIGHMIGRGSPTMALGLGAGAIGGAAGGPVAAGIAGAVGFAAGSALQEFVPAYQRARVAGLDHNQAIDRALMESGVASAFGAAMGGIGPAMTWLRPVVSRALIDSGAVSLRNAGRISRGIGAAGSVPAQLGVVQPGLAVGQGEAAAAIEGRTPTWEERFQTGALGIAQGLPFLAVHGLSSGRAPDSPPPGRIADERPAPGGQAAASQQALSPSDAEPPRMRAPALSTGLPDEPRSGEAPPPPAPPPPPPPRAEPPTPATPPAGAAAPVDVGLRMPPRQEQSTAPGEAAASQGRLDERNPGGATGNTAPGGPTIAEPTPIRRGAGAGSEDKAASPAQENDRASVRIAANAHAEPLEATPEARAVEVQAAQAVGAIFARKAPPGSTFALVGRITDAAGNPQHGAAVRSSGLRMAWLALKMVDPASGKWRPLRELRASTNHEVFHLVWDLLRPNERAAVVRVYRGEEGGAEGFARWAGGRRGGMGGVVLRAFKRIGETIRAIASWIAEKGFRQPGDLFVSPADVFARVERRQVRDRSSPEARLERPQSGTASPEPHERLAGELNASFRAGEEAQRPPWGNPMLGGTQHEEPALFQPAGTASAANASGHVEPSRPDTPGGAAAADSPGSVRIGTPAGPVEVQFRDPLLARLFGLGQPDPTYGSEAGARSSARFEEVVNILTQLLGNPPGLRNKENALRTALDWHREVLRRAEEAARSGNATLEIATHADPAAPQLRSLYYTPKGLSRTERGKSAVIAGNDGERLAGIDPSREKERINIGSEAEPNWIVPDIFNEVLKILGEVKNVAYLRLNAQLRTYLDLAKARQFEMVLWVSQRTVCSRELQRLILRGVITLRYLEGPLPANRVARC